MNDHLGKILQRARKRKTPGTLRALADSAGVSNAYLCQLEQSRDRLLQISWLNLQRISGAYEIPLDELELHMRAAAARCGLLEDKRPKREKRHARNKEA